jgi:hypothetical protein
MRLFEPQVNGNAAKCRQIIDNLPREVASIEDDDPLRKLTPKQQFFAAVWISDLPALQKLFLFCIWRYFDCNARSSSMSYQQIARDCSFDESTSKRIARNVTEGWLKIGVGKGYPTRFGRTNLYHGVIPSDVLAKLRADLGRSTANGVALSDPASQDGVAQSDHQGWRSATRTSDNTSDKKLGGVAQVEGKPVLHNGTRLHWEAELGGASQLDRALIEIAALPNRYVDPASPGYAKQVEGQLARRARERQDRLGNQPKGPAEPAHRIAPKTVRYARPAPEVF